MAIYDYQCNECGHTFEKSLKISEMKQPESEPCPACEAFAVEKILLGAPAMGDPVRLGVRKLPGDFKEVLSKISERNYRSNLKDKLSRS
jgi:putative FmdB family regulatory protein